MKRSLIVLICILGMGINASASTGKPKGDDEKGDPKGKVRLTVPKNSLPGTLEFKKTKAQPDVPGALVIEFGMTLLNQKPESMRINQWGSWTTNFYYLYEFIIGKSNFSFNIGPGISIEKLRFFDDVTLGTVLNDEATIVEPIDNVLPNNTGVKKSLIDMVYVDVPIEFRYHSNKYDFKRSFKVAIGGKIGYRVTSKTKIKYEEFNQTKIFKSKENYNFENFRYGVQGRIGYGGIGIFYYHSLTPLFQNNRGPELTDAFNSVIGLSLSGF